MKPGKTSSSIFIALQQQVHQEEPGLSVPNVMTEVMLRFGLVNHCLPTYLKTCEWNCFMCPFYHRSVYSRIKSAVS
jgi:hypothetical protein